MRARALIPLLLTFAPAQGPTPAPAPGVGDAPCLVCFFQREANLLYILQRAMEATDAPGENESFGHCFVCVHCEGAGLPDCRGWWPAEPEGHDYEGDPGRLVDDYDEVWERVDCVGMPRAEAEAFRGWMLSYSERETYQVINRGGGRSCLGFCTDAADAVGQPWVASMGDLTAPGALWLPYPQARGVNPGDVPADVYMLLATSP